jgi:hypothetical protein
MQAMPLSSVRQAEVAALGDDAPAQRRAGVVAALLGALLHYKEASALIILIALCVLLSIMDRGFISERSLTLVA